MDRSSETSAGAPAPAQAGRRRRLTPAARTGLAIAAAISLYGVSFGALSLAAGLTVLQTMALSALMFTGASQFAFIGVIGGGGGGAAALGAASLLGIRNAIYGVQMKAMLAPRGLRRLAAAQVTIDESAANAMARTDPAEQRRGFWWAGIACYLGWNAATLLGTVVGDRIEDPEVYGLDGAVVAAFLGLLWPRLKSLESWALAVVAALVTTLTMPVLPEGIPVLLAAVVAVLWGLTTQGRGRGDEVR